MHGHMNVKI